MGGRKVWTQETLSVPDMQEFLQDQVVMRFPNASARDAAIPDPEDGMVTWLDDNGLGSGSLEIHDFGWHPVGAAGWARAQLRQTTSLGNQTAGQYVRLPFQAEDLDTHQGHDTSSNTDRWTCPGGQGGWYALQGVVAFASTPGTVTYVARWEKNNTPLPGSVTAIAVAFGPAFTVPRRLVELQPGDWVSLSATVLGGAWGTATAPGDPVGSMMTVERVS